MKRKKEGGLNMTDFTLFDKAIKLCWVKRLCSAEHSPYAWKIIPLSLLSNVGGFLLFRCNYDVKFLKRSDLLPTFYKNIIAYWQELNTHVLNNKGEVPNKTIWNNRFIKNKQDIRVSSKLEQKRRPNFVLPYECFRKQFPFLRQFSGQI